MKMKEIITKHFSIIEDTRCDCNVKHKLSNILIVVMCAVLCGLDTLSDIVEYGEQKAKMLYDRFGIEKIPSESTLCRVLSMINPELLGICIVNIMREFIGENGDIIAIDGKAICSTETMKAYTRGLRVVTAYMTECGISLGQLAVDCKTNEIPCVKELVELLDVDGKIITADAEHCQKETIEKIISKNADYCICLKGNQRSLFEDVKLYAESVINGEFSCETAQTSEKGHGRYEKRKCYLFDDINWLSQKSEWQNLKSIFAIQRVVIRTDGTKTEEVSHYISSLDVPPERFLEIVRNHWKIESMHWQLDMVFNEDDCRITSENGQKSMNIMRKLALSLHKNHKNISKHKKSIKKYMLNCLLNDEELFNVIKLQ